MREINAKLQVENLKERAYLGEADMDDRVVLH
jgi:hypothetical protein